MALTMIQLACYFLFLLLFLLYCYPAVMNFLSAKHMFRPNYRGELIPVSVGIIIPITNLVALPVAAAAGVQSEFTLQTICLTVMAFIGWKDDRFGGEEAKGLKGHILFSFKQRKISTGLWKAVIGCGIAIYMSAVYSATLWLFVLHCLLIGLLTNLINLFDLRPGRALKGFFVVFALLLGKSYEEMPIWQWLPTIVTALFLFEKDLKGMLMLGDAGSNCLGLVLGFWIMLYAPVPFKVIMVCVALFVHVYAERNSLSQFIQRTSILRWLDMLGR